MSCIFGGGNSGLKICFGQINVFPFNKILQNMVSREPLIDTHPVNCSVLQVRRGVFNLII